MADSPEDTEVPVEDIPEEHVPGAQVPAADLPEESDSKPYQMDKMLGYGDQSAPFQVKNVPGVAAQGDKETADTTTPYRGPLDPVGMAGNMIAGPVVDAVAEPFEALVGNEIGSVGKNVADGLLPNARAAAGIAPEASAEETAQGLAAQAPTSIKDMAAQTAAQREALNKASRTQYKSRFADGGVVGEEVPSDDLPTAGAGGDEVPVDDLPAESDAVKYAGAGNTAAAAIEGIPFASVALKGLRSGAAAIGVPDQYLDYIAPSGEEMAGRAAAHPTASTVGNVAGSVAELGALPEIGAETALGRVGAGAAKLGVFQGAATAADDWSKDKPLDAEKIAANAGVGAALGAAGPLAGATVGKISKTLGWLDQVAQDAQPGEGFVGTIQRGYQAAGKAAPEYTGKLTDNLNDLYQSASAATDDMYENAGQRALGDALSPSADPAEAPQLLEQAKAVADSTFSKIKDLTVPGEGESPALPLSPRSSSFVTSNLQTAAEAIQDAKTPLDVHNAMSKLATDIDRGIKFDKLPTASDQADQAIIKNIRGAIRGDLRDPDLWGNAAGVYGELTDNYSAYKVAQKNFQRDFMKSRTGSNGSTIKVIDPVKVNSYFADPQAPAQILKQGSLNDFAKAADANARLANNYDAYKQGLEDLAKNSDVREALGANRAALTNLQKTAKSGESGIGTLAALEFLPLPAPVKAAVLALKKYARPGGGLLIGGDLEKILKTSKWMTDTTTKVGNKISSGAKAIFRAGAADERQ